MPSYENRFGTFIEIAGKSKEQSYKELLTKFNNLNSDLCDKYTIFPIPTDIQFIETDEFMSVKWSLELPEIIK